MPCSFSCKKIKELAGNPGEGIHKARINDAALVDYVGTILISIVLSKILKTPLVMTTILLLILREVMHKVCGVQTSTLKYLGL